MTVDGYEQRGQVDGGLELSKTDHNRQHAAETMRDAVQRMHYHKILVGESAGHWMSHIHDGDDDPDHTHADQRYPLRADGGFWEETGPTLGREHPPFPQETADRIATILMRSVQPSELMRWRLRLYCGHIVERTAHATHKTLQSAFMSAFACPECGLEPATIVAAEAFGLVEAPKVKARAKAKPKPPTPAERIRQLEAENAELRHRLNGQT